VGLSPPGFFKKLSAPQRRSGGKIMYFEKVRDALAAQFELDPETITMETNLIDDLGADSLDVVELIMNIEDEFGISISDEEAANLFSVQKIVEFLEKLQ
jgi:acyl carrier protein